ncbi:MAG TPA: hypothetical protein VGO42_11250 [Reyranella sp.]|nr:hypothetical protein [Reyranella sp.]
MLIDDLLGDFQHGRIGQRQVGMADLLGLAHLLVCAQRRQQDLIAAQITAKACMPVLPDGTR